MKIWSYIKELKPNKCFCNLTKSNEVFLYSVKVSLQEVGNVLILLRKGAYLIYVQNFKTSFSLFWIIHKSF